MATDFNETPGAARYRKPGGGSAGQLFKSPVVKLVALVIVLGGGGFAATQFLGKSAPEQQTSLTPGEVSQKATVGTTEITPEYMQEVQKADDIRTEKARGRGESAVPTPMLNPVASPTMDEQVTAEENNDPLQQFESMISAGNNQRTKAPQMAQQAPVDQMPAQPQVSPEALQNATRAIRGQMEMMMRQWEPTSMSTVTTTTSHDTPETAAEAAARVNAAGQEAPARTIIEAGQVYYGQMMMEANSDVPGPIMAQILTGPLAGGRAIGSFETFRNHLSLRFKTVAIRGQQVPVDILALDPDTTLGGVATEVDPRYFSRVVMPAAAAFISAFGETLATPSSTTTVTSGGVSTSSQEGGNEWKDGMYAGIGEGFSRVADFVDEEASSIKRLVRIEVGTPIGLFFVSPVQE